jgi:hypothetical protein
MSANATSSSSSSQNYPHATLLKSPRLILQSDLKRQYTPPPMLSPFRKGPGLYYKYFADMFFCQQQQQQQQQQAAAAAAAALTFQYNHSMSYPAAAAPPPPSSSSSHTFFSSCYPNKENNNDSSFISEGEAQEEEEEEETTLNDLSDVSQYECNKFEEKIDYQMSQQQHQQQQDQISMSNLCEQVLSSSRTSDNLPAEKKMLKRPRLMSSQMSSQTSNGGSFFPDENTDTNKMAALIEYSEVHAAKPPFVNIGDEFQAILPKIRKLSDESSSSVESTREDLMWSHETLDKVSTCELTNYLKLVCKSSLVYGSSNNLELGLHVLHYFGGDTHKAIKAFFNDAIELPAQHPIATYKYTETDVWTPAQIKMFENSLLNNDKVFSEIANEIGKKTTKQCIEFYYLWKKVMSDSVRKKWRLLKKNRLCVLTSSSSSNNETQKLTEYNQLPLLDAATPPPAANKRFDCDKCNLVFKTKKKLRYHMTSKHY